MTRRLDVVFMGTPAFAVAALDAIVAAGHNVVAVYAQPPRPAGRGQKEQRAPVHVRADELSIPVYTPVSLKKDADARAVFAAHKADIAVVAAYGLILPRAVLDAPQYGCINIHASLLPRWRGAAPIQRAIMAGDRESGVCIMQMEEGLDTGPVLMRGATPITDATNAAVLHDALAVIGADLVVKTLAAIDDITPETQSEAGVTYAHMLKKEEGRIDWRKSARDIDLQIRGLTPYPGVWTTFDGARLKILSAEITEGSPANKPAGTILSRDMVVACGDGFLRLLTVQPESKKPMDAGSFANGFHVETGMILS